MRNGSGEKLALKEQMFSFNEDKTGCAWGSVFPEGSFFPVNTNIYIN